MISDGAWGAISSSPLEGILRRSFPEAGRLIDNIGEIRKFLDREVRSEHKEALLRRCRSTLPIEAIGWMDAVMVVNGDGEAQFPPVLGGTGGNEGRLEYSKTFMSYLVDLLLSKDRGRSKELLANSLFGTPTDKYTINKMGMFDPGRAGGFNQGVGIESKDFPANPWDFVLSIEGSILWASSITRREGGLSGTLSSPFATRARGIGYSSASEEDGASATCEIWAPVWRNPASLRELTYLMAEGRAYLGRSTPDHGVQFAVALANLGVDRGLDEFVRYGMLVRRGDSKVMMPLGRFKVRQVPQAHLLEELERILAALDAQLRLGTETTPASISSARRAVDKSILDVVSHGSATSFRELLRAIGHLEKVLNRGNLGAEPRLSRPLRGLSPEWLLACDDGSPEVRLAGSVSSLFDKEIGQWRVHMAPVDPKRPYAWSPGTVRWSGPEGISIRISPRRCTSASRWHPDRKARILFEAPSPFIRAMLSCCCRADSTRSPWKSFSGG
jgi:CRISPR-associated protein Csx17